MVKSLLMFFKDEFIKLVELAKSDLPLKEKLISIAKNKISISILAAIIVILLIPSNKSNSKIHKIYAEKLNQANSECSSLKNSVESTETTISDITKKIKDFDNSYKGSGVTRSKVEDGLDQEKELLFKQRHKYEECQNNLKLAKRHLEVVDGKESVDTFDDYYVYTGASDNEVYKKQPPVDGPSSNDQYFMWTGTLVKKDGNTYLVWDVTKDFVAQIWNDNVHGLEVDPYVKSGFAFKSIKKKFSELKQGQRVKVVGRYSSNYEVTLVSGQSVIIPVLEDCYVE